MKPSKFDGILYQLRHWIFHTVFTRRSVLRCNAAFAILFCAGAAVPESIIRLYAVVSVTDLVIRPRTRKRGSANFDLDRSKLRFTSFTVDSPRLKPRTKTRQCCADIKSPRAAKRVIFQAWVRGESEGTQSSNAAEARRTNSKGDPRTPAPSMPIKVRTTQLAPSWKSFSSLETFWQFKWIKLKNRNLFFNRLRPPLVTIATFKVDACFWKAHFGSFHAKAYQNSMFLLLPWRMAEL